MPQDDVFIRLDNFVASLEEEGIPLNLILDVMQDYIDLCDEFL